MIFLLIIFTLVTFGGGVAIGRIGRPTIPKERLIDGSVPIAGLIADFEDFARNVEGGTLSKEADAAIKVLQKHAEQKYLPAAKDKRPAKDKKPFTFEGSDRKDEWCDLRCFEKEMATASNDDERLVIIRRWMKKYYFTTKRGWQTWSIQQMSGSEARDKLRTLFDEQTR